MTVKSLNSAGRALVRKLKEYLVKTQAQKNVNNMNNFNQSIIIYYRIFKYVGIELILF